MISPEIQENLSEDALFFEDPEYDDAIIGYSVDGAVVYDCEKIIDLLVNRDNMEFEQACEFFNKNVLYFAQCMQPLGVPLVLVNLVGRESVD